MKKLLILAASAAVCLSAVPAYAAITLSATPGASIYAGPTPTFDFNSATPEYNGTIFSGSLGGVRAQPFGSTGGYISVGPTDGAPRTLNLSAFGLISEISFIWGSVDAYNTLQVLDAASNVTATFTGANAAVNPNGNQTSPTTNPIAKLTFTGADQGLVAGLRFNSTGNAFEVDNVAIKSTAVPEPATWMMMFVGFAALGRSMRRRHATRVAFA